MRKTFLYFWREETRFESVTAPFWAQIRPEIRTYLYFGATWTFVAPDVQPETKKLLFAKWSEKPITVPRPLQTQLNFSIQKWQSWIPLIPATRAQIAENFNILFCQHSRAVLGDSRPGTERWTVSEYTVWHIEIREIVGLTYSHWMALRSTAAPFERSWVAAMTIYEVRAENGRIAIAIEYNASMNAKATRHFELTFECRSNR